MSADIARARFERRLPRLPSHLKKWYQVEKRGFAPIGARFLRLMKEDCGLHAETRLFDPGCDIGRVSIHFVDALWPDGRYVGMDIVKPAIAWAERSFAPVSDAFTFLHADVWNSYYNPAGTVEAADYRFPLEDASFDTAMATSLFTHLRADATRNYLSEIARLLAPGGTGLLTFFLLNRQARKAIRRGEAVKQFETPLEDGSFTQSRKLPEMAVAHNEAFLLDTLREVGLELARPTDYGNWTGRSVRFAQDHVYVTKPS